MPIWTESPETPREIAVLLFDRFSNLCLAHCLEPLRAANAHAARPAYRWRVYSPDGAPVCSSSGLRLTPDAALPALGRADLLMILCSYGHAEADTAATRRLLRQAAGRAGTVAGYDAGPWLMASAGLLDGRRATLHDTLRDGFAERFHAVTLVPAPHVEDGNRVTCAGALAAYDLSRAWLTRDLGTSAAVDIDTLFLGVRPGPALPMRGDVLVTQLAARMRARLEDPEPLADLAAALGVTPRTLDRRCRAALGVGPGQLYLHLRLSAARQMLEGSGLPVAEIALRCGYQDPAAFARAVRRRFGQSPSQLRRAPVPGEFPDYGPERPHLPGIKRE